MTDGELVEKYIDIWVPKICFDISKQCEADLSQCGLDISRQIYENLSISCKELTDENLRFLCKGFTDENFDTLLEECQNWITKKTTVYSWIFNILRNTKTEDKVIGVDFRQVYKPNNFTERDVKKIKKILASKKNYSYIYDKLFDRCMARIGNLIALRDILYYITYYKKQCILYRNPNYV